MLAFRDIGVNTDPWVVPQERLMPAVPLTPVPLACTTSAANDCRGTEPALPAKTDSASSSE